MSTQYLQFSAAPSQTCTPKLFGLGGDAVLFTGSAIADSPSGSGLYKSTFSEASALNGTYRCVVFVGSVGVAGYEVKFTGTDTEVAQGAEFTNASGGDTAAQIYTYFTDANREDAFKADSTLAKQNEILAKLSTTTQVFTDPDMANPRKITIIRGDAYDSVSWPAKSWDVGRDINGLTFRFTIKDQIDGNVIFQSTGTGVGQVAAPVITSAQSLLLQKTEVGDEYYWDVEIEYTATSFGTPLYGTVEVVDDVTTPGDRS